MSTSSGRARPASAGRSGRDDGMVTAEFAVALPAFVLVVVAALTGVAVVLAQLRCVDAAAAAARMAARGEASAAVRSLALADAPSGASVGVQRGQATVTAIVTTTVHPLGGLGFLPGIPVSGRVVEPVEPQPAGAVAP